MIELDFSQARVLVVGDVMLDQYWQGGTERISPEAPVPIVHIKHIREVPGGAANVAVNVAALGGHVTLLGLTGQDEAAIRLVELLKAQGVNPRLIELEGHLTTRKLRITSRTQQLIRLDTEDPSPRIDHRLLRDFKSQLPHHDVVILADYNKGTLDKPRDYIKLAKEAGIPILVDPKRAFVHYHGASIITPNLKEFEAEVGPVLHQDDLIDKARLVIEAQQLQALVITRAEQGISLIPKEGEVTHLKAQVRQVFDITGAGDTVIAVMAAWLSQHPEDLVGATRLGNLAAGLVVAKTGTASVSLQELEEALKPKASVSGFLTEATLLNQVAQARANNEKIVMTNGCFDLLHLGHVRYLTEARGLGDRLVVAVNTDDSVKRLKGDSRPINTHTHRASLLAALGVVDWVVTFEDDTPTRLIELIKPEIYTKGGDYHDISKLPGAAEVLAYGGHVECLHLEPDLSTTRLIERIKAMADT